MGNPAGTEKRVKSREANCWQSFFIRRGQHVKDFSRTTAEISQLSSQLLFSIFFSIFWLINIKNSQLHFHGNWQRQKRNGKQKYFFSGSQLRAGSVELEKLQQLVVPGGQPTIEPKRARTHTNTNTARIRIRCCNLATWVSQEKCGWNILVTFFSVVLVWNTFKGDFLGRLKKCLL